MSKYSTIYNRQQLDTDANLVTRTRRGRTLVRETDGRIAKTNVSVADLDRAAKRQSENERQIELYGTVLFM